MYQIAIDIYVCLHTLYKHIYLYIITLYVYKYMVYVLHVYQHIYDIMISNLHRPLPSLGLCLGGAVPGIIAGVQH